MSGRPPLHGYNTNYRREGVVYHVQTEDLGQPISAIVTQVFTGGTILAKKRTEYKEILDADDLEAQLRVRMQKQHKELLIAVRDGEINSDSPTAPAAEKPKKAKKKLPLPEGIDLRDTVQMELPPEFYQELDIASPNDDLIIEDFPPPSPAQPPKPSPEPSSQKTRESEAPPKAESSAPRPAPASTTPPAPVSPAIPKLKLPPPVPPPKIKPKIAPKVTQHASPPPPPPPVARNLRTPLPPPVPPVAKVPKSKPKLKPKPSLPKVQVPPQPTEPKPAEAQPAEAQPAEAQPAETQPQRRPRIFAEVSRPSKGAAEEQLGERSLDEVILSYLAEDLQED